ncbi:ABC transporter substrate-binding protein [Neorickettsia findlayensis]|uniref:ABC transporter substrate-binding protein n=1 Tax=Neorickettsia findlayensis TaxID=2686014 RepID=A0A6P1GBD6_9RICK|nr:ABC transporter substrate-binding protein [Neorickettsia findlayensis]QHD65513.1 ABC transporter substrate-binding protein [Neorickettsia findlayensis]
MLRPNKTKWLIWLLFVTLLSSSKTFAEDSTGEFISSLYTNVTTINSSNISELDKLQHMTKLIEENIDFQKVVSFVLGRNISKLSPEELQAFTEGYKKITSLKYAKLMTKKLKYYKILREEDLGNQRHLVQTVLQEKLESSSVPLRVDYLVTVEDRKYKILDIIVSGSISMAMADREEIDTFLQDNTPKGLLAIVKTRPYNEA